MPECKVRIVSFNICGIKGILGRSAQWLPERSFKSMFDSLEADIICFQETKINAQDITKEMAIVPHFNSFFTCSVSKRGYSGVAIYVRDTIRVFKAEEGLTGLLQSGAGGEFAPYRDKPDSLGPGIYPEGMNETHGRYLDSQGRSITLDLGGAVLIGVYCPADSQGNMGEFRDEFYQLLDWRISKLQERGRKVVLLGDLNVAREPRDSAPLRDEFQKLRKEIDTEEWKYGSVPRKAVNGWIEDMGFQDTCRVFHEDRKDMYTCWDQQKNCRPANFGSRIDYVLVDKELRCVDADIMPKLVGSDHCPLYADVVIEVEPQGAAKLPFLNRNISNVWSRGIKSFFKSESPKPVSTVKTASAVAPHAAKQLSTVLIKEEVAQPEARALESAMAETIHAVHPTSTAQQNNTAKSNSPVEPKIKVESIGTRESVGPAQPKSAVPQNNVKAPRADGEVKPRPKQQSISLMFGLKNEEWKKLNRKLDPPLCDHGEQCILKTSTKPPRKGERFWMCGRSMGGKVNKERKFRCKTFIWDSERR